MQKVIMASAAEGSVEGEIIETFIKLDDGYEDRMDQMRKFQNKLKERIADKSLSNPKSAVSVHNFVSEKLVILRHLRMKLLDKMELLKSCLRKEPHCQQESVKDLATELKNMFNLLYKTLKDCEENKDVRFYKLLFEVSRSDFDPNKAPKREFFELYQNMNDRLEDLLNSMEMLKDRLNEKLADKIINDLSLLKLNSSVEKYLTEKIDYLRTLKLKCQDKMTYLKFCLKEGQHFELGVVEGFVFEIENINEALNKTIEDFNGNQDLLLLKKLQDDYQNE